MLYIGPVASLKKLLIYMTFAYGLTAGLNILNSGTFVAYDYK